MNKYLYFTVFIAGMTTLAVEMSASHLIGPYFGDSRLVWASLIGLIMIYLTAGYALGGRLADRKPYALTLYRVLAWSAFTAGVVPYLATWVLGPAADAFEKMQLGILFGSFVAVLILFSVPVTLLGMISPFAVRLAIRDPDTSGSVAGKISAISTLGSFLGTFLPVLVLIPWVGTRTTFLIFSGVLLLTAFAGIQRSGGWRALLPVIWMPLIIAIMALLFTFRPVRASSGLIYETESSYNYIQVVERDGMHVLRLNEGLGDHSMYKPGVLDYDGPWEQFLAAPFFNHAPFTPTQVKRIAVIGLAAGTTARQASAVFGPVPIDGYELDERIIHVGKTYFDMNMPNLNAFAQDGRWGIAHSSERYTLIIVDAYRPPYIPWHLTTREFFNEIADHLEDDGVVAINVGRAPNDRRLVDGLAGTLGAVFPSVFIMDLPYSFNSIVYATKQPATWVDLYNNYILLAKTPDVHPLLLKVMGSAIINRQPTPEKGAVFTDDRAPIEWLTHSLMARFIFSGGVNELAQ